MRYIAAVSNIASISVLMVGFTGRLCTSLCCLCPCMCTLVFPPVCVLGGLLGILRRFSLGFHSCLDVFIAHPCSRFCPFYTFSQEL